MRCLLCSEKIEGTLTIIDIILLNNTTKTMCEKCKNTFQKIEINRCSSCYKIGKLSKCLDCERWEKKGHIVTHTALYQYNDEMKDYFSKYKFQGDYLLKEIFKKEFSKYIQKHFNNYKILPVPLSKERQDQRGFNQVSELLIGHGNIIEDLIGKKETDKQIEKNKYEREQSDNPFYIKDKSFIAEKIVIVDDIYTTGTTIYHITKLLNKMDCKCIKSISLAR